MSKFNTEKEELDYYRSLLKDGQKPKSFSNTLAEYLGLFCAYGLIVLILWLCWNESLVKLWPNIPEISPLQMAGLWYLSSVLLKRN